MMMLAALMLAGQELAAPAGQEVPLEVWQGRKTAAFDTRIFAVSVSLNGSPALRLGLDTNTGEVVLSEGAADLAGVKKGSPLRISWAGNKKIQGYLMRNTGIEMAGFKGTVRLGVIVPDDEFRELYPKLDGLLGLGFLEEHTWTLDPRRPSLTLAPLGTPVPSDPGVKVPFRLDPERGIVLSVKIGGVQQQFTVHTGLSDVFVDEGVAKTLKLDVTGPIREDAQIPYRVGPRVSVALDGMTVDGVQVYVTTQTGWAHLGQSFMNRFVTTWDMQRKQVLFTQP